MLTITLKIEENGYDEYKVLTNLEYEFTKLTLEDSELNRKLIREIEQGEYLDSSRFLDRFGTALYYSEMSTGCKGALVVVNNPEVQYDISECGWNARDAIIRHCRDGRILMPYPYLAVAFDEKNPKSMECDVFMDGFRFTDIVRLNYYLTDEMPSAPDLEIAGVEKFESA